MSNEIHSGEFGSPVERRGVSKRRRRLIMLICGVLALVVLAGAAWFILHKPSKQQVAVSQKAAVTDTFVPAPADPTPVVFKSTKLNIEITYRKDWTMRENVKDGELIVSSPRVAFTQLDGKSKTGVFKLRIRQGTPIEMQKTIEAAVAVRDSKVIAYAAPTEAQRFYTNVSYAGTKDAFQFFIITGSTGLKAAAPFQYQLTYTKDGLLIAGGFGDDQSETLGYELVAPTNIDSATAQQATAIVESLEIF